MFKCEFMYIYDLFLFLQFCSDDRGLDVIDNVWFIFIRINFYTLMIVTIVTNCLIFFIIIKFTLRAN